MLLDGWQSVWQRAGCDGGDSRKFWWWKGENPFLTGFWELQVVVVWGVLSTVKSILWLVHRLALCWCLSRRDNGGGYAGLELRKMRRKWELVSALCVVEGAHVRMYTWWRHWTTFVYFDPFIHLHIEGRLLEMKTLAHLVCAVFSLPRMLFFMW